MGVVAVVGGEQRRPQLTGDVDEAGVGLRLQLEAVVLELDEEMLPAEYVLEPPGRLGGPGEIAPLQGLENEPAEATRGGDDARVVALEQLPVEPGLVVVALQVGRARELHEVAVANGGLGQEREVVVALLPSLDVAAGVVDPAAPHRSLVAAG